MRAIKPSPEVLRLLSGADDMSVLEDLLARIVNPESRAAALESLHELAEYLSHANKAGDSSPRLLMRSIDVPETGKPIRLLLHPAVFTPELWGRTFAEGLLKNAVQFDGKSIVELGTGSGWISIMLAQKCAVKSILALDLNPIAVLCANLNVWLNGTASDGTLLLTRAGAPLVETVRVAKSDLLEHALSRNERFDHVIGCIPQVLHPDLTAPLDEGAKHEDLYDLSNYCFRQGVLEDRYGLPLIARALEESQLCLNQSGKVTLILGGRPGRDAIESMFARRGFQSELIWSRRIPQADDTDLDSLVKLEELYRIRFHFFMSRDSTQSVSADTAVKLLQQNKLIYHDLLVYEAHTRFERPTFELVRNFHSLRLDSVRRELDFSRVSEERMSFLSKLSHDLLRDGRIPYPHERGDMSLRRLLSRFLHVYCHHEIDAEQLFIGPDRAQLLAVVLKMVAQPGGTILLSDSLKNTFREVVDSNGFGVVESNDDLPEILALDETLCPNASIIAPRQLSNPSPLMLNAIAEHARKHPDRLYVIDDSGNFDISSDLNSNILIRLAADRSLPSNVVLLYGLIKNTVQPDLELSFLLNAPEDWLPALDIGAELTYSRIAFPSQHYYEWLFADLLSFTFGETGDIVPAKQKKRIKTSMQSSSLYKSLAEDPVFLPKPINPESHGVIRLDYGELQFPVPPALVHGLFKGFVEDRAEGLSDFVRGRIVEYWRKTRSARCRQERIVLAQGVFSLFGSLIRVLKERLKRAPLIAVPDGTYGPVYPMIAYHGGEIVRIPTDVTCGFQVSPKSLTDLPQRPDLLWITQPGNPSGFFMDSTRVKSLLQTCADLGIFLFADEIFFLLSDNRMGSATAPALSFGSLTDAPGSEWLFVADGIAKSFAAGGMRCGFMVCPDEQWASDLTRHTPQPPQSSLRALDALYARFVENSARDEDHYVPRAEHVDDYLSAVRNVLTHQRTALLSLLRRYGVDDGCENADRGGLFVLARLDDHLEALAVQEQLLLNPGAWSRAGGWSRVCIGLTEDRFAEAMIRLDCYLSAHAGTCS